MNILTAKKLQAESLDDAISNCVNDGSLQGKQMGVVYCKAPASSCIYYFPHVSINAHDYETRGVYRCFLCKNEYKGGRRNGNRG